MRTERTLRRKALALFVEGLLPPRMTAEERSLYRSQQDEIVLDRFRRGVPYGAMACLVVATVGSLGQPSGAAWEVRIGGAVATVTALISLPLSRSAWVRVRPNLLLFFASLVVAAAGALIAAFTGGFESVATATITLLWVFGSIVTPLSPIHALMDALGQLAVATLVILIASPHPGSPAMFAVLNAFGIAFLLVGLTLRERATVRAFLVQRSLDEANRALASLNAELERRVDEQVAETKKRARDVDILNAQLQQRVIERSRELALALARLARPARLASPPVGSVLNGRLELVRTIDSGGMGDVFEGFDRVTQARVAVKTLHARRLSDVSSLQRFLTEARAAAAVRHEGIVRTLDIDVTEDGTLFHVMELLEGRTLAEWLENTSRRPVGRIAQIGRALAQALQAAHAAGVVHRDIKPANVMLIDGPPGVKLLDFGVSKLRDAPAEQVGSTEAHMLLGTPAYMAPEQASEPGIASPPADVYSLGVVLYEALSGALPHEASRASDFAVLRATVPPRDLLERRPEVPGPLAGVVMQCIEKDPQKRPDAGALAGLLGPFIDSRIELVSERPPVDAHASTVLTDPASHERTRGP